MPGCVRHRPLLLLLALLALLAAGRAGAFGGQRLGLQHSTPATPANQGPGPATPRPPASYDLSPVTELIETSVRSIPLDGASLLLIKDGQVIYERAFGSYTVDTTVNIASGSKWLTAATIMTLVDDGLLALDDPVARYLPTFRGAAAGVTLRQLLSHTSGLPDYDPCLDGDTTLAGCVEHIAQVGVASPPGSAFVYGNVSLQAAGRMAEVASGKPWATLFDERIRRPLGLAVTAYQPELNPFLAGGVVTNLREYGRFLEMQLDGGLYGGRRVLSAAAVREMQRDQTGGVPIVVSLHGDGRRYGLGEWRDAADAQGNAAQLSSQGDTGFSPWIDLERHLAGVFLVYDHLGNVQQLVSRIQEEARAILDSAPGPAPAP